MNVNSTFLNNAFIDSISKSKDENKDSNAFINLLDSVSKQDNSVSSMKTEYMNGERDDIENILIESEKLGLELNFLLEVRNNIVNTMQTLSNMQV